MSNHRERRYHFSKRSSRAPWVYFTGAQYVARFEWAVSLHS
jgi:hypothetical protein